MAGSDQLIHRDNFETEKSVLVNRGTWEWALELAHLQYKSNMVPQASRLALGNRVEQNIIAQTDIIQVNDRIGKAIRQM